LALTLKPGNARPRDPFDIGKLAPYQYSTGWFQDHRVNAAC
jgi:hypothetical protein